ncbi:WD40-repeat-containing domain protein, partial [Tribonema minus]
GGENAERWSIGTRPASWGGAATAADTATVVGGTREGGGGGGSRDGSGSGSSGRCSSCTQPILSAAPVRVLEGHTQEVLSLSWGRSDLLLSASMDCSVRLWHVAQGVCLGDYRHPKVVTSVDFHPLTDGFFLTGCMDKRLRLWDVPNGKV